MAEHCEFIHKGLATQRTVQGPGLRHTQPDVHVIVVPSFTISDLASPAAAFDLLSEWAWYGFAKLELSLPERAGLSADRRSLELICRECAVPVQLDTSAEEMDDLATLVDAGASSLVVGTRALEDPDWLHEAADAFPGVLAVRIPGRERRQRTRGAMRVTPVDLSDEIATLSAYPLASIIVSFGAEALEHRDLADLEDLAGESPIPISIWTSAPTIELFRDLEFRGISGTIAPHTSLSEMFDEQTLARSFAD